MTVGVLGVGGAFARSAGPRPSPPPPSRPSCSWGAARTTPPGASGGCRSWLWLEGSYLWSRGWATDARPSWRLSKPWQHANLNKKDNKHFLTQIANRFYLNYLPTDFNELPADLLLNLNQNYSDFKTQNIGETSTHISQTFKLISHLIYYFKYLNINTVNEIYRVHPPPYSPLVVSHYRQRQNLSS